MNKVVFITGASRGIGAATVAKFLAEGWSVAGFYKQNRLPNTESSKYYQMDVADELSVKGAFSKAFSDFGKVDALVNCAGIVVDKKLSEYTLEDIGRIVGVNELGVFLCTKEILGKMKAGVIVNVGSTGAFAGSYDSIYAATKGAVHSFTKSMALELAPDIRVNSVAPGLTKTDMGMTGWKPEELKERVRAIPLGEMARPEDIANGIYFLASDQASHITGACLDINGGYVLR